MQAFLDAAYTVWVEEYQRLGMNLPDALEQTQQWRAGGPEEMKAEDVIERRQRQAAAGTTASQNDQSLQALQMMLAGTTKA